MADQPWIPLDSGPPEIHPVRMPVGHEPIGWFESDVLLFWVETAHESGHRHGRLVEHDGKQYFTEDDNGGSSREHPLQNVSHWLAITAPGHCNNQ